MMRSCPLIVIGILAAFSAACRPGEAPPASPTGSDPPAATPSSWPATQPTDRNNFTVTLQPTDGRIERGRHFSLELTIDPGNGAAGSTTAELDIAVDADMPAHRHGMNTQPEVVALGDSRYRVDGMLFHMSGDWVVTVEIARGTESERASFPVHVE